MNVSILVIISFILISYYKNDRKKDDSHRFVHGICLQHSEIQILTVVTEKNKC